MRAFLLGDAEAWQGVGAEAGPANQKPAGFVVFMISQALVITG
jgi:hypothetical protein